MTPSEQLTAVRKADNSIVYAEPVPVVFSALDDTVLPELPEMPEMCSEVTVPTLRPFKLLNGDVVYAVPLPAKAIVPLDDAILPPPPSTVHDSLYTPLNQLQPVTKQNGDIAYAEAIAVEFSARQTLPDLPTLAEVSQATGATAAPAVLSTLRPFQTTNGDVIYATAVPIQVAAADGTVLPPPPAVGSALSEVQAVPVRTTDGDVAFAAPAHVEYVASDGTALPPPPAVAAVAAVAGVSGADRLNTMKPFKLEDGSVIYASAVAAKAVTTHGISLPPPPAAVLEGTQNGLSYEVVQDNEGALQYAEAVGVTFVALDDTVLPEAPSAITVAAVDSSMPSRRLADFKPYKMADGSVLFGAAVAVKGEAADGSVLPPPPPVVVSRMIEDNANFEPVRAETGEISYAEAVPLKFTALDGTVLPEPDQVTSAAPLAAARPFRMENGDVMFTQAVPTVLVAADGSALPPPPAVLEASEATVGSQSELVPARNNHGEVVYAKPVDVRPVALDESELPPLPNFDDIVDTVGVVSAAAVAASLRPFKADDGAIFYATVATESVAQARSIDMPTAPAPKGTVAVVTLDDKVVFAEAVPHSIEAVNGSPLPAPPSSVAAGLCAGAADVAVPMELADGTISYVTPIATKVIAVSGETLPPPPKVCSSLFFVRTLNILYSVIMWMSP